MATVSSHTIGFDNTKYYKYGSVPVIPNLISPTSLETDGPEIKEQLEEINEEQERYEEVLEKMDERLKKLEDENQDMKDYIEYVTYATQAFSGTIFPFEEKNSWKDILDTYRKGVPNHTEWIGDYNFKANLKTQLKSIVI